LVFLIAGTGYSVNSFLAAFNMIPVYTLDGLKVIKWNVGVWLIVFAVSVAMMLLSIIIGVENMVMMIITLNP
jgi:Zn-dependent protease